MIAVETSPASNDEGSERLVCWLAEIAGGDQRALGKLMHATRDRLHAEAKRLLKVEACADEALQDCWLRVWRHASSFDPRLSRPMTWLLRVVQNRAVDMLRSRRHERERAVEFDQASAAAVADEQPGPEARWIARKRQAMLQVQLRGLVPEQRQALSLMLYRGLSHPEIARNCRVPESTVKSWVRRGVARLHQQHPELRWAA